MRVAALVLGLIGSFLMLIVGVLWTDAAQHLQEAEDALVAKPRAPKPAAA